MGSFLSMLLGILLRIGLPLLVSLGVFYLLRRLDERWQAQARLLPVIPAGQTPCWEAKKCPDEKKKNCAAFQRSQVPCWQVFRAKDGNLREACLSCEVFRTALIPIRS